MVLSITIFPFNRILIAPYEDRDGWELNVMFVNGTLYFEEHATEERLAERWNYLVTDSLTRCIRFLMGWNRANMNARQRSQMYYGYAFESYCTSEKPITREPRSNPHPEDPPGWGGDVNTNVQWCSVVRTKLGDTRMIIGGEVDCVRGDVLARPWYSVLTNILCNRQIYRSIWHIRGIKNVSCDPWTTGQWEIWKVRFELSHSGSLTLEF